MKRQQRQNLRLYDKYMLAIGFLIGTIVTMVLSIALNLLFLTRAMLEARLGVL
jgi:hypothetical protein